MYRRTALVAAALFAATGAALIAHGSEESARSPIAERAVAFLQTLTPAQRERARAPFISAEREDWHYVPRPRKGVALKELNAKQRAALDKLFTSVLTAEGSRKLKGVLTLEGVLVEFGENPAFRDPGRYFTRVFGDPAGKKPWGFRFEGHHISLNYTSQGGVRFSGTPAFFGANPHRVPRGKHAGLRVLGREEDLARKLLTGLTPKQAKRAVLANRAPREIVSGARSRVRLEKFEGLPASALSAAQQKQLRALIELYARNHREAVADSFLKRINAAGFDKVHFAWAGAAEPNKPHYYRVHGPTFVIEYVNAQNGGNHSHTVLRDFAHDFGRDWLAEHLKRGH
ncbi:MAG: DUF3500 domain-containing protein [Planctomycetota bacterium]|jgi:hypothetical protein